MASRTSRTASKDIITLRGSTAIVSDFFEWLEAGKLQRIVLVIMKTFSDVGPIRRCFMVTQKGSTEHRGFAYVQFAVTEDANRAIELKNGSSIGGRTIGVKQAMHRAPLEQRRLKGNEVVLSDDTIKGKDVNTDIDDNIMKREDVKDDSLLNSDEVVRTKDVKDYLSAPILKHKKTRDSQEKGKNDMLEKGAIPLKTEQAEGDSPTPIVKHKQAPDSQEKGKIDKPKKAMITVKSKHVEGISSEKQRVARTVVIGGLHNKDMAEDVHLLAKECGLVSSITYPLPKEEITHHDMACQSGSVHKLKPLELAYRYNDFASPSLVTTPDDLLLAERILNSSSFVPA